MQVCCCSFFKFKCLKGNWFTFTTYLCRRFSPLLWQLSLNACGNLNMCRSVEYEDALIAIFCVNFDLWSFKTPITVFFFLSKNYNWPHTWLFFRFQWNGKLNRCWYYCCVQWTFLCCVWKTSEQIEFRHVQTKLSLSSILSKVVEHVDYWIFLYIQYTYWVVFIYSYTCRVLNWKRKYRAILLISTKTFQRLKITSCCLLLSCDVTLLHVLQTNVSELFFKIYTVFKYTDGYSSALCCIKIFLILAHVEQNIRHWKVCDRPISAADIGCTKK